MWLFSSLKTFPTHQTRKLMNLIPNQFFFFCVNLYCVSNLLVEMYKYYQAELPFSYLQLSTMCELFKFKMNYLNTHTHSSILLDDWVISLPSKESKDSFCPVQGAVWSQDQDWAFCLLCAASHIRPLPTVLLQSDPGMDSSGPLCPKWQSSTECHSQNKSRLPWPREPACFMGRGSQFPCVLVSAPALKADTFIRLSMHLFLCLGRGTHTLTHTPLYHRGASGEEPTCKYRRHKTHGFDPWVGKILWRRAWRPTPVLLPGESHGQRSLVGYSP